MFYLFFKHSYIRRNRKNLKIEFEEKVLTFMRILFMVIDLHLGMENFLGKN